MVFTVEPHVRLQEWVAEERGFFAAEGLEYEFEAGGFAAGTAGTVSSADSAPLSVRSGAFEDMAAGRSSDVSCAWGAPAYLLEQRGFRKLVDTTFVMSFLVAPAAAAEDVERYFRALLRAQQEIDLDLHRYTGHWAREMPADLLGLVDVRRFGPGERIVPQRYTREMFERTQGWMREWGLLDLTDPDGARYDQTVLA